MTDKGPFTLTVTDTAGEQVFTCEVAIGVPKTIGWNLSLEQGRLGLAVEIVTAIVQHNLEITLCPTCKGEGTVEVDNPPGSDLNLQDVTCWACGGSGSKTK
jgi:hypothetical protein